MKKLKIYLGQIGSGKDYEATRAGGAKIAFGSPICEMAWSLLGWKPEDQMQYELFKEGKALIPDFGYVNGRKFLQRVGQEMRTINPNFWCEKWSKSVRASSQDNLVATDCRFPAEVYAALRLEGIVLQFIWCEYESQKYLDNKNDPDISEAFSQFLATKGLIHGQVIPPNDIIRYTREYDEEKSNG